MKYHVEKSTVIRADAAAVRKHVEDFTKWSSWSPWTVIEPECSVTVEGNPGAVGHKMSWKGEIIGSGTNTLVKKEANELHYNLEFLGPWKSKATSSFRFDQESDGLKVTWTLDSSMPIFLFFFVTIMKNWIGMDYDRGLRMLKEITEKGSISASTTNNGIVDREGFSYVGIQRNVPFDEISTSMQYDFDRLIDDIVVKKGRSAKSWVSLYPKMDMKKMQMTYIAAVSDESLQDVSLGSEYVRGSVKTGRALEIKHDGPYDFIGNGWSMGMMYLRAKKLKGGGVPFEYYWNSPKEVAPEELKTSIYFPLKG